MVVGGGARWVGGGHGGSGGDGGGGRGRGRAWRVVWNGFRGNGE